MLREEAVVGGRRGKWSREGDMGGRREESVGEGTGPTEAGEGGSAAEREGVRRGVGGVRDGRVVARPSTLRASRSEREEGGLGV